MFGLPGHLYVYFTYGIHYRCNIVVGEQGDGAAALIRAVGPLTGEDSLKPRRPNKSGVELTNGPAKLCQALGIKKAMNGHNPTELPLRLIIKPPLSTASIVTTTRIGISQDREVRWRFYDKDRAYVSAK